MQLRNLLPARLHPENLDGDELQPNDGFVWIQDSTHAKDIALGAKRDFSAPAEITHGEYPAKFDPRNYSGYLQVGAGTGRKLDDITCVSAFVLDADVKAGENRDWGAAVKSIRNALEDNPTLLWRTSPTGGVQALYQLNRRLRDQAEISEFFIGLEVLLGNKPGLDGSVFQPNRLFRANTAGWDEEAHGHQVLHNSEETPVDVDEIISKGREAELRLRPKIDFKDGRWTKVGLTGFLTWNVFVTVDGRKDLVDFALEKAGWRRGNHGRPRQRDGFIDHDWIHPRGESQRSISISTYPNGARRVHIWSDTCGIPKDTGSIHYLLMHLLGEQWATIQRGILQSQMWAAWNPPDAEPVRELEEISTEVSNFLTRHRFDQLKETASVATLCCMDYDDERYLFERGTVNIVFSKPNLGKTKFVMNCVDRILTENPDMKALWVDLEMREGKLGALVKTELKFANPDRVWAIFDDELPQLTSYLKAPETAPVFAQALIDLGISLVVIDSFNKGEQVTPRSGPARDSLMFNSLDWMNSFVRPLGRNGSTVIVIDHSFKTNQQEAADPSGSSVKRAEADCVIRLDVKPGEKFSAYSTKLQPGTLTALITKSRNATWATAEKTSEASPESAFRVNVWVDEETGALTFRHKLFEEVEGRNVIPDELAEMRKKWMARSRCAKTLLRLLRDRPTGATIRDLRRSVLRAGELYEIRSEMCHALLEEMVDEGVIEPLTTSKTQKLVVQDFEKLTKLIHRFDSNDLPDDYKGELLAGSNLPEWLNEE